MNMAFLNSQNLAQLLKHLAEKVEYETRLPLLEIERLERSVNELKSCADSVLELSKKERAQEEAKFNDEHSSED